MPWVCPGKRDVEVLIWSVQNMFWPWLRLILGRAVRRGLKWAPRGAQNRFMPKNINFIAIIITFEGTEKIKTEKKGSKTVWRIFLSPTLQENGNKHCNGFSILIGCLRCTITYFSLFAGLFQRAQIHFTLKIFVCRAIFKVCRIS